MGGAVQLNGLGRVLFHAVPVFKALAHQHLGPGIALLGGLGKQLRRGVVVLLKIDALVVEITQVALGGGIVLVGPLLIELRRPALVHLHPVAQLIAQAQLGGGGGVALLRRVGEQLHRPDLVLLHANAPDVAQTQVVLGGDVVPLRRLLEPVESLFTVLGGALVAVVIAAAQAVLGVQVPFLSGRLNGLQVLLLPLRHIVQAAHYLGINIDHYRVLVIGLRVFIFFVCHLGRFLSIFL